PPFQMAVFKFSGPTMAAPPAPYGSSAASRFGMPHAGLLTGLCRLPGALRFSFYGLHSKWLFSSGPADSYPDKSSDCYPI
ncbi:MAG: hypothetical protein LUE26_05360, partial [Alistipes sp.]|nr:hypothetical protein [Alistipes sp.]